MAILAILSNHDSLIAIAQSTDATDVSGEIAALRQLLDYVEFKGLLVQAVALHANRPFPLA